MNEPSPSVALKCVMSRPRVVSRVSGARTLIVQGLGARPVAGSRRPVGLFDNLNIPFTDAQHREVMLLLTYSPISLESDPDRRRELFNLSFLYDQPRAHGHAAGWFTQDPTSCRAAQHRPHQPTTKPPNKPPRPRAPESSVLRHGPFQAKVAKSKFQALRHEKWRDHSARSLAIPIPRL